MPSTLLVWTRVETLAVMRQAQIYGSDFVCVVGASCASMRRIAGRHGRNDRTTHLMNEQEKWPIGVSTWQYLYSGCGDVTSVLF